MDVPPHSAGNIGIATTTIGERLTVSGDSEIISSKTHVSGDLGASDAIFRLYNNYNNDVAEKGAVLTFEDNYLGINRTTRAAIKGGTATAGNTANGYLAFYTDSGTANSMQERMRINQSGTVGIGTTDPGEKLEVLYSSGAKFPVLHYSGYPQLVGNGNWLFLGGTQVAGSFIPDGDLTRPFGQSDRRFSTFYSKNITDNGTNVGIGILSPGYKTEIQRIETVNRTSYNDILSVTANATTNPYSGHGGGIVFKGTTYRSGTGNVNYARIGSTLNDHSASTAGSDLFFDVSKIVSNRSSIVSPNCRATFGSSDFNCCFTF